MTNLLGKIFSVINEYSMGYKYKVIIIFGIKFIPVGWWVTKEQREYIAEQVIKYAK